ncbi:MAG: molybdate ABC transporter permease subunit [Dehalococcoidia bacterium]|nr:molybdate ABC transporter permease subunit [Dehalococcoidia bacterium]
MRVSGDRAATATIVLLAAVFTLFFLLPFAGLVDRAIQDGNTWELLRTETVRKALVLSLWTSTLTAFIAVVLGTPVAYLLARARFPGRAVVDAFIDLPIVLPPTVAGVALLTAFGRRGLIGEPIEAWTGFTFGFRTTAVVMAQLLVAAPFYVRAAKSGFESVDPQLERVAYTLGASRVRTFVRITAPQAWPALVAGLVLCWSRAMGELGATLIFAGNLEGRTQTMPLAVISAFEGSSLGLSGAVALSLILLAAAMVVMVAFRLAAARGSTA